MATALAGVSTTSGVTQSINVSFNDVNGAAHSITVTIGFNTTTKKITANGADVMSATGSGGTVMAADMGDVLKKTLDADSDFKNSFGDANVTGTLTFTSKTFGAKGEAITGISVDGTGDATTHKTGTDGFDKADVTAGTVYDGTAATKAGSVFTVNGQKFAFVLNGKSAADLGSDVNAVFTTHNVATALTNADVKNMSDMINAKTGLATDDSTTFIQFKTGTAKLDGNALVFQVGSENTDDQRASLSIGNMNAASLGLNALNISDPTGAKAAIDIISKASASVSTARAQLGALQNELEHTANNLSTMNENLSSAESTIRDVDMTNEYVQFSKNQILTQAANSMLAQANAQPQNVLSLLKG